MAKQNCNCTQYANLLERVTRLEEQKNNEIEKIKLQQEAGYEKNRKFLEKVAKQHKKINTFLQILEFIFKTKKRVVGFFLLRFLLLSLWFMFLDSWNSEVLQHGHFKENIVYPLLELLKEWNNI